LNTLFKFCVEKGYVSTNPVANIRQHRVKKQRATPATLSAAQSGALMAFLETYAGPQRKKRYISGEPGCLVPYFALCLFAGVRPDWRHGEIGKLPPEDFQYETQVIHIEPHVSKVGQKRTIKIQPNLALWLEKYPPERFTVHSQSLFEKMCTEIRNKFGIGHDGLRHTFVSMLVGAFRSVGDASLQSGNSESVIRRYYLDLKSEDEAERFWRICPHGMALPDKMVKKDGRYVVSQPNDNGGKPPREKIADSPA